MVEGTSLYLTPQHTDRTNLASRNRYTGLTQLCINLFHKGEELLFGSDASGDHRSITLEKFIPGFPGWRSLALTIGAWVPR